MNVEEIPFSQVNAAAYNPRIRLRKGDQEYTNIEASLKEFGLVQTLVYNKRSGNLVGGHQRMWILEDQGHTAAKFTVVDLDPDKEQRLNIILNKVTGKWDKPKLEEILASMHTASFDLSTLGFNPVELNDLLKPKIKPTKRGPDDAPEPTKDELAITRTGDLYHFISADGHPQHWLLCGDSERPQDLETLMQGQRARMLFTDPHYGVTFKGEYRGQEACAPIINDDLRGARLLEFLKNAFTAAYPHTIPSAAFYCFHAFKTWAEFDGALVASGWEIRQQIIWKKHFTLSRSGYHWAHEPILYGGKAGVNPEWFGQRTETTIHDTADEDWAKMSKDDLLKILGDLRETSTVWTESRGSGIDFVHPTQKPTALARRAMRISTMPGDNVLELFAGSGSTIIGGEMENRNVYALEQSRGHCDAIVRRYLETFPDVAVTRNGNEFTLSHLGNA